MKQNTGYLTLTSLNNAEQFYECSAMLGILSIAKDYEHAENAKQCLKC